MVPRTTALSPLFPHLSLLIDSTPRPAAANMAFDEALLRSGLPFPVLRFYRWRNPAFTFGYFQPWRTMTPFLEPGTEWMRRWTGGGIVDHRHDLTYSLVIPGSTPLFPPRESYRKIHERLASTLQEFGCNCRLAAEGAATESAQACCFAGGHAQHDVLAEGKVAGAAQRRHRLGILHQGSIAVAGLPEAFPHRFAAVLAEDSAPLIPPEDLETRAATLESQRYGSTAWLELR